MQYISTRGEAPKLGFDDVLLAGLATDGGLYVPETWPQVDADTLRAWRGLSYQELAVEVMLPFVEQSIPREDFAVLVNRAYETFAHKAVTPVKQLDTNVYLLELFHGPTLAFKDCALQLLGHLFDYVLERRDERVTIVGATSGDTGSAAIEAIKGRSRADIFILFPEGRVSPVQQRQMTTVDADNVHALAIEGTFDDCQDLVKAMFADADFRGEVGLSAVNSINWARIMAQIVYYFWAALRLGAPDREIDFCVPTGNFGNVFAGYAAKQMGLPIGQLMVGSNRNDILTRFFQDDDMSIKGVEPSLSPSMDIQISSNFERYLFDLLDRNGNATAKTMLDFRSSGRMAVGQGGWEKAKAEFHGFSLSDPKCVDAMKTWYAETGEVLDPHTVIGVEHAAQFGRPDVPAVALATAHPAKFPAAVEQALGFEPALPTHLSDLYERSESFTSLPNQLKEIQQHVRANRRQ